MSVTEMPERERPLSEQFRIVAKQWVDAHAAAQLLEETKTPALAQRIMREIAASDGQSLAYNRAEAIVKASDDWQQYLTEMVEARSRANKLKVQMEYIQMKFSEWQSINANARQERQLSR